MFVNRLVTTLNRIIKNNLTKEQKRFYKTTYVPSERLNLTPKVEPVVEPPPGVTFHVHNRNPRNLERLLIAHQHQGWSLEKPRRSYYHKILVQQFRGNVTASVIHFSNYTVLSASTNEWSIRKRLYKAGDKSAWINLGRVFARRSIECGITEMLCTYSPIANGKLDVLLKEIQNGGICFTEGKQIVHFIDPIIKTNSEMLYDVEEDE